MDPSRLVLLVNKVQWLKPARAKTTDPHVLVTWVKEIGGRKPGEPVEVRQFSGKLSRLPVKRGTQGLLNFFQRLTTFKVIFRRSAACDPEKQVGLCS